VWYGRRSLLLLSGTKPLVFAALPALALATACAPNVPRTVDSPAVVSSPAACRMPIAPDGARASESIAWSQPSAARDALNARCATTAPPVIDPEPAYGSGDGDGLADFDELVLVSWNVHIGAGNVAELVYGLRSGALTNGEPVDHFVLLLQEAYRADPIVAPNANRGEVRERPRADIVRLAQSLGLSLYYVPSMRNGAPGEGDRGNAILSTEPLTDFAAIELPLERQRRVAVAAAVSGWNAAGDRWTLNLASAHLESTVPASRLWVFATGARTRQARALLDGLEEDEPVVLGGDFNTWFGFSDPTYSTIAARIPDATRADRRPTFPPFFRLDHLFSRGPQGWTLSAARLDDRLGSDHYPLLGRFGRLTARHN
jgi:endonuclease/exonuclease/phosphatase family metal-dependent hydrolase